MDKMARKVVLPSELSIRLGKLTKLKEEIKGALFYQDIRNHPDYCILEDMFMTAVGDEGHVQAEPQRLEVVNEFFARNPQYRYVEFHTHSYGTLAKFGMYYARNFSGGDMDSIRDKFAHDEGYIHMLVIPKTKLLWGGDNPELIIRNDFSIKDDSNRALSVIARNKRIDLGTLRAHGRI